MINSINTINSIPPGRVRLHRDPGCEDRRPSDRKREGSSCPGGHCLPPADRPHPPGCVRLHQDPVC